MIHSTDVFALKAKLNYLKHKLQREQRPQNEKDLADEYLNEVLFLVDSVLR
jgi:hypothetical protein